MDRRGFVTSLAALAATTALPAPAEAAGRKFCSGCGANQRVHDPCGCGSDWPPSFAFCPGCRYDHRPYQQMLQRGHNPHGSVGIVGCNCESPYSQIWKASQLNAWLRGHHSGEGWVVLVNMKIDCDEPLHIPPAASKVVIQGCRILVREGVECAVRLGEVPVATLRNFHRRGEKVAIHTFLDNELMEEEWVNSMRSAAGPHWSCWA